MENLLDDDKAIFKQPASTSPQCGNLLDGRKASSNIKSAHQMQLMQEVFMAWMTFDQINFPGLRHIFTLRSSQATDSISSLSQTLQELRFPEGSPVEAEQVHGSRVAIVSEVDKGKQAEGADALVTRSLRTTLLVRTADCGPIFLFDPVQQAIGLVHSGKKGTSLNILNCTIEVMQQAFGTRSDDLIVLLGPCIRPPHYEVDFAREIALQAQHAGVRQFHDCRLNTGADLTRFYSYRVEKGKTGRHYAAICLT